MLEFTAPKTVLDPDHVFTCGQTFRFRKEGGMWRGVARGSLVEVAAAADNAKIVICGDDPAAESWRRYFDLDTDYSGLLPDGDPVLNEAVRSAPGLRVLRQEPFETLISFIISANNNIPRITRIVEAVCAEAGSVFCAGGRELRAFPSPAQLAALSETSLRSLGAGYRAPYILGAARRATEEDLASLRHLPTPEVLRHLEQYPGVGPKVAACIALFAFGRWDTFPADVWIRRIMRELYGFEGSPRALQEFAAERFGSAAGLAQQYLFHYARRHLPVGK